MKEPNSVWNVCIQKNKVAINTTTPLPLEVLILCTSKRPLPPSSDMNSEKGVDSVGVGDWTDSTECTESLSLVDDYGRPPSLR